METTQVELACEGDIDAFAALVQHYTNAVCSVAFGVLGDYHLAQDVAQETFIRAFLKLKTLQDPQKFGSWIYSIAARLSLDWRRKMSRESRLAEQLQPDSIGSSDGAAVQRDLQIDIWDSLQKLDESSRTVVMLFYMNEWSMSEIGAFMNVSVSAVESRLRRTRKLLREELFTSWGEQFRDRHSSNAVVAKVVARIVKQAGQYYIPVTNRQHTADWFVAHFGIARERNGHLLLPSGHTLYLIEVHPSVIKERARPDMPVLVFQVEDPANLYNELKKRHIRVEQDPVMGMIGDSYSFFDLDGNRFGFLA